MLYQMMNHLPCEIQVRSQPNVKIGYTRPSN